MAEFLGSTTGVVTAMVVLGGVLASKVITGFFALIKAARILKKLEIGSAIASAFKAAFSSPASLITGGIAGLAIGAALTAGILTAVNKAKDFAQPGEDTLVSAQSGLEEGGFGKRALLERGQITLFDDNDDIVAGTDLFQETNLAQNTSSNLDKADKIQESAMEKMADGIIGEEGKTSLPEGAVSITPQQQQLETTLKPEATQNLVVQQQKTQEIDYGKMAAALKEGASEIADSVASRTGTIVFDDVNSRSKANSRGLFVNNLKNQTSFI